MRYMVRPLSFRWDERFLARLDEARGDVPRSRFVRRAVEQVLTVRLGESDAMPLDNDDPVNAQGRGRPSPPVPAEQPDAREVARREYAEPVERAEGAVAAYQRATFSPLGPPGRARRSGEAKRGVQPIAKGGKKS